jgi:hypothetical protein
VKYKEKLCVLCVSVVRLGLDSISFSADAPVLQQLTHPNLRAMLLQEKRPNLVGRYVELPKRE